MQWFGVGGRHNIAGVENGSVEDGGGAAPTEVAQDSKKKEIEQKISAVWKLAVGFAVVVL